MGYFANRLKKRLEKMTDEQLEKKFLEMEEECNIGPEASEFIKEQEKIIIEQKETFDSRIRKVRCCTCGKEMEIPNMLAEENRKLLKPYCCASTVFTTQWLLCHGWHVTTHDANPAGAYFCPDCFPKGQPEYTKSPYAKAWCKQAEVWMEEE